jgi:hypothetical protein
MTDPWTYADDEGDLVTVLGDDTTGDPVTEEWDAPEIVGGEWPWSGP